MWGGGWVSCISLVECGTGELEVPGSNRTWRTPPRPGGSVVSMSDSRPGEFDTGRGKLFLAYFCPSPLKHVINAVSRCGKKTVLVLV